MKDLIKTLLREAISGPIFNENFMNWFRGSQVVDEAGNPLVCYHGTSKAFSTFNSKHSAQGIFWFSSDKDKIANGDSGAAGREAVIPVYLSAKKLAGWEEYGKLGLGQIESMGFDGIKLDDDYIIFEPNQIKSVNNKGEWNPANKNIFK